MEILDFLKEIMESVSDPLAGGTIDVEVRVGQDDEERHCACCCGAKEVMQKKG